MTRGVVHARAGLRTVRAWVWYRVGIPEGAIPGTTPAPRKEVPYPAKRAPEAHRAGVGGVWGRVRVLGVRGRRRGRPCTHPAGPVGLGLPALPGARPLGLPPPGLYGEN